VARNAVLVRPPARPAAPARLVVPVAELRLRTEVVANFLSESLAAAVLGGRTGLPAAPSGGGEGR
jgi:hypothetical protein